MKAGLVGWLALGIAAAAAVVEVTTGSGGRDVRPLLVVASLAVVIGALAGRTLGRRAAASAGALAAGWLLLSVRILVAPTPVAPPLELPTGRGPWTGVVESLGSPRRGAQIAILVLEPAGLRVSATLPRYPPVEPGDRVVVDGPIRAPPDDAYGAYLGRIGVAGTLRAASLRLDGPAAGGAGTLLERLRRRSGDALAAVLPEPEAGLAAGILVGLRERVERDLASAFTSAGVSHIVAISGWNIAIVAGVAGALARGSPIRRALAIGAVVAGYTAFAGASPSVVRAAVMALVALVARTSGRPGRAGVALAWAVALLLLVEPRLVADVGFQLSAVATAGLVAGATTGERLVRRATRDRLPGWVAESLGISLAAQAATLPVVLVAFGRLAPIAPLVNLVVVPLVPPAMAAGVVALGVGWLTVLGAPPTLGSLGALPAWLALTAIVRLVGLAATLPGASLELPRPIALGAALAIVAVALGGRLVRRSKRPAMLPSVGIGAPVRPSSSRRPDIAKRGRRARRGEALERAARRLFVVCLAGTVAVGAAGVAYRPDGVARLIVLDVGQGDAILVEDGHGRRLLVDGGPDPDRLLPALDRHVPPWARRLDGVVLTHPHEDHVAGLALLLARYRVGAVFEPGTRGPGPGYAAWSSLLGDAEPAASGSPRSAGPSGTFGPSRSRRSAGPSGTFGPSRSRRLATGDSIRLGRIRLRVLWPDRTAVPRDPPDTGTAINNVSIVLLGTVDGRRFLLTGDIEQAIDPLLVARGLPRVDVLKVAHHGSRTSSTEPFVDAVRPAIAIVSAGAGNPYGHPSRNTLARLASAGARVYRTDRNGSVTIALDPRGPWVAVERGQAAAAATRAARGSTERPVGRRFAATGTGAEAAESASSGSAAVGLAAATSGRAGRPVRAFLCAVPLALAPPVPPPAADAYVPARTSRYHRGDDDPRPDRECGAPPVARPPGLVPPPLPGGRGGRGLARRARRAGRRHDRPPPRRGCGPPPRRRQARSAGRARVRAPPR